MFLKGQTYYMFFLFAKTATKQTYQIYVGPGFTVGTKAPSDQTSDLHAVRADLTSRPVNKFTNVDWPTAWTVDYNNTEACGSSVPNCGILQITIDMKDQTDLELKPKNGLCLPSTFCKSADGATGNGPCGGNPDMKKDPSVLANPASLRRNRQDLQDLGGPGCGLPATPDLWASPSRCPTIRTARAWRTGRPRSSSRPRRTPASPIG